MRAKVCTSCFHESRQIFSRHIDLCNHLASALRTLQTRVQFTMIVIQIDTQLVRVRPVNLPVGRKIMVGINVKSSLAVGVRKEEELSPLLSRKFLVMLR